MGARKPAHLVRRGDTYYFRAAIPGRLRGWFSRLEFKISLRTTDRGQAALRQHWLSYLWHQITHALSTMAATTSFRIDQAVREYFAAEVENLVLHAESAAHPAFEIGREIADAEEVLGNLRQRIGSRQYTGVDVNEAEKALKQVSLELPSKGSDFFNEVCNKTLRARAEAVRIFIALLQGRHDETIPKDPLFVEDRRQEQIIGKPSNGATRLGREKASKTVSELSKTFIEEHRQAWGEKTVLDKLRVNNWFIQLVGADTVIGDVTPDTIIEFKSLLMKVPANLVKYKDLRERPLAAAIEEGAKRGLPRLSLRTANKYMEMLKTFFTWVCDHRYMAENPVGRISLPYKRSQSLGARQSYQVEQLNQLFSSSLYTGHKSASRRHLPGTLVVRDGRYWVPLIALFSGMRVGEIVQLQLKDVRLVEQWWVFDVNKGDDGSKAVKTVSSVRQVPVHPTLAELGFMEWIQAEKSNRPSVDRLFPEINVGSRGDASHDFSKQYGRYTKLIKMKTERTAFHSFRHNFVDALRAAGVQEYVFEALTGHSRGKVSSGYGSAGVPLQLRAEAIASVRYQGLKLDHLMPPVQLMGMGG